MSVVNKGVVSKSVRKQSKQKQINLNEYYALTADSMNIVLLVQTKDKDGKRTGNYRSLGYYSSVEACIKKIQTELILTYLPQVNELESLSTMLESYLSKLHDDVREVVKELRSSQIKEIK